MSEPVLLHPDLRSRIRLSSVAMTYALAAGVLLAGTLAARALWPASEICVLPAPVTIVRAPEVPPPAPAPETSAQQPAAASIVEDDSTPLRSIVPILDAACVVINSEEPPAACALHDGFPAVSADGSRVAVKRYDGSEHSDLSGFAIEVIDTTTSRVVRREVVATLAEVGAVGDDSSALRATMTTRAARIQRMLDAGGYRALQPLGHHDAYGNSTEVDSSSTYAEFQDAVVRVIDPHTHTILGRLDFTVPPRKAEDASDDCSAWKLRSVDVMWDPESKIVLGTTAYDEGGCMCETFETSSVKRLR